MGTGGRGPGLQDAPKVTGAVLGLAGFTIALVVALLSGVPSIDALLRAIFCAILCNIIGHLIGWVGRRVIDEFIESYVREHTVPEAIEVAATDGSIPLVDEAKDI